MRLREQPLIDAAEIERRVSELAQQISSDYTGREILLVAVLKGSILFTADLMRRLTTPVVLEFLRARSYQDTESTGHVECTLFPEHALKDQHVLLVEDILDTGRTASVIIEKIRQAQPASVALCTLLDKPSRRVVPVEADYVGFTIEDRFVVGYGLDYSERGRELPSLFVLDNDEQN